MTRQRSTYVYGSQIVRSPDGTRTLAFSASSQQLTLTNLGREVWTRSAPPVSPKQVFVAKNGSAALLDASDTLHFLDAKGRTTAEVRLVQLLLAENPDAVQSSTAGMQWDDFLAATFADADPSLFIADGRGAAPLAFDATSGSRCPLPASDLRGALSARVAIILTEALDALRRSTSEASPAGRRDHFHADPWRLAAAGWARVAGGVSLSVTDEEVVANGLRELGSLPMATSGVTSLGLLNPVSGDPIRVAKFALDPLRQATHTALRRLGVEAPTSPVVELARRRGFLRTDWVAIERPDDGVEALRTIDTGAGPSAVVADCGAPTHIGWDKRGTVVWSYDHVVEGEPATAAIGWGKRGAEFVTHEQSIPPPTPSGRVA